ncbi:MAG: hypothetical protein HQ510_06305 [Candidatus Marinimicrobia bacterium]|nr:hypothetical protein [Candidatus Neomarinimicrobiota bacterium]
MKYIDQNKLIFGISIFILSLNLFSQTEATTKDGKKVILKDNGTWKYTRIDVVDEEVAAVSCDYSKNEIDEFTGDVLKVTKPILIGKFKRNKLYVAYQSKTDKYGKTISLIFSGFGDLKCDDENSSSIMLKFEDGEIVELNGYTENCGDNTEFTGEISFISFAKSSEENLPSKTIYDVADEIRPKTIYDVADEIRLQSGGKISVLESIRMASARQFTPTKTAHEYFWDALGLPVESFNKIKTNRIEKIRIQGSDSFLDFIILEDKREVFMNYILCVQ